MRDWAAVSGTETNIILLAEKLASEGHEVHYLSAHALAGIDRGVSYFKAPHYPRGCHYDVVFDTFLGDCEKYDILADRMIIWMHCPVFSDFVVWPRDLPGVVAKIGAKEVVFVSPSQWTKEAVCSRYGFDPSIYHVVGNAIEKGRIVPDATARKLHHFIFHSSFERGGDVFLRVFDALPSHSKTKTVCGYVEGGNTTKTLGKNALYGELIKADYAIFPLVLPSGVVHKDTYNCCIHEAMAAGAICLAPRIRPLECVWGDKVHWVDVPTGYSPEVHGYDPYTSDPAFQSEQYVQSFVQAIQDLDRQPHFKEYVRQRGVGWAQHHNINARYQEWKKAVPGL